ncbi:unnamed protein product [Pleuronectes platessa]|uniref:Uncharacterized protein n=1 Tax=Pleuronectes platessa TaxID=8262 RepID=A0A9N7TK33_PLEPL|nr:unnamed protein product [Pleuronectes platessa]
MPVTRYLVTRYSNLTAFFSNDPLGTSCGWGSSRPVALLTTPPEARCAALLDVFLGGRCSSAVRGLSYSMPRGGVRRRCGRRGPVGGDRERRSATATLDVCRALLADHLSYSAR